MQYATEEAKKDVYNKALTCLEEYYESYDPTSYNRSYSLENAFLPYTHIQSNNTQIISTVGVMYDTSLLTGYIVGSNDYGSRDIDKGKDILPIEEWIMNNYLDGVHPYTNGYPTKPGTTHMEYYEIMDPVSPTQKMDDYLEKYAKTFRDNVYSYLAAYLMK